VVRRPKEQRRGDDSVELVSAELVERCKRGDENAWNELVRATHRDVYSLCLRILRDPDDAAEATQDAYLKAWRGLRGFRGDAMFTTWLYRVATNAAISKQRKRGRTREHEAGTDDGEEIRIASTVSTEQIVDARLELRAVEAAVARLPGHLRAAVVLRDVYGASIDDIARELGISATAAKVRVHRGRKRVKREVYGDDAEVEA
jgi:RNA polymerase sigma-70 factor (ECF subfamily)